MPTGSEDTRALPVIGQVCDREGDVVPGALVNVLNADGSQVGCGRTDDRGLARLLLPDAGTYLMVASAGDCQPAATYVTLDAGQHDYTVSIRLDTPQGRGQRAAPGGAGPALAGRTGHDPALAQAAVGLTAALLAMRLLTEPDRYPTLVATAARLAPDSAPPDDPRERARRVAQEVLLPSARRLLAPLEQHPRTQQERGSRGHDD